MSYLLPAGLIAYSDLESDNLTLGVTPLPVALTATPYGSNISAMYGDIDDPAPNTPQAEPGERVRTSFDDWYYRIHVIPATLDLGNIAGDVDRAVVVWSGFFEPKPFTAFSIGGDGIEAVGDLDPPAALPPLHEMRYTITVRAEGPAVIDGVVTWTIDGVEYAVPIIGRRSTLFGFRPDWKMGRVLDTYQWLNTVVTLRSGAEQVQRIRPEPRRLLEYRMRLFDAEARLFDSSTFGWAGRPFATPWWHERTRVENDVAAGAAFIPFDTTGLSFSAQNSAVLFASAGDYEILDVAEVLPEGLVINNATARAWPRGSMVVPLMSAIPQETFDTARALPKHVDTSAKFTAVPAGAVINLPIEPAPETYRGYELYTGETNWRNALSVSSTDRRKVIDGGTGPLRIAPLVDFPLVVRGFSWLLKSRAQARTLLAFFARREGRRYPVWMPSGFGDFVIRESIVGGIPSIKVQAAEYSQLIRNHPARRDIVLILRDGRRLPRRIERVENSGEGSTIVIDSAFDNDIPMHLVKRISYLGLYRLATDEVTFSWATPHVAEVETQFVLKKDAP